MERATVSTKYQVVIPKKVREELGIKPGQKVHVIPYEGRIELIPVRADAKGPGIPSMAWTRPSSVSPIGYATSSTHLAGLSTSRPDRTLPSLKMRSRQPAI